MSGELQNVELEEIALAIAGAYGGSPIPPVRTRLGSEANALAYQVQALNTRRWTERGRRVVGRKVGLTSKAVQAQLGVNQPDYGVLFDDMRLADGARIAPGRLIQPKIEAEVAIVLGRDITNPRPDFYDVLAATDYALPAIEIVDSRIADWDITFADTVADNGSSGLFVLGTTPRRLEGLDLATCGMTMKANGRLVSSGVGAACLGHPLHAAAWLAQTAAEHGDRLRAGDVILTGALGPMLVLTPGSHVRAEIGGLGAVEFTYAEGGES